MSLDHDSWERLLAATIKATETRKLVWREEPIVRGVGLDGFRQTLLSQLGAPKKFYAVTTSFSYELSADVYGRAPYELTIWNRGGPKPDVLANFKSSSAFNEPSTIEINQKLETLFRIVNGSSERKMKDFEKLLDELGE
ncbi:hypothetical protein [Leucobacter salsicius]|uniref:hypothetical protein n=1 Tax=Leucobacter salsicius TaxID=664638 RepID=UPI00035E27E9|nr:hypothetical protein [Leucobacter salsicius]